MLLEGLGWQVGNGWSINAFNDKWVMIDGKMQSPIATNTPTHDLLVGELIDHDAMQWRVDLIRHTFDHFSAKAIMALPLCK